MKIYPAIDILGGKAVRLKQGRKEDATVYGDPVEMAIKWAEKGAEWLHIVDLDGAFEGEPRNSAVLRQIVRAVPKVRVQAGGGIRNIAIVNDLRTAGVERVVLGTAALRDPEFLDEAVGSHRSHIAVGIDARDGRVQVSGWTEGSQVTVIDFARQLQDRGVSLIIYTDISRDGVLTGPNVTATREMLEATRLFVIASGGVSSIEDVQRLAELGHPRLDGVIIGKALYEGRIEMEEALASAR